MQHKESNHQEESTPDSVPLSSQAVQAQPKIQAVIPDFAFYKPDGVTVATILANVISDSPPAWDSIKIGNAIEIKGDDKGLRVYSQYFDSSQNFEIEFDFGKMRINIFSNVGDTRTLIGTLPAAKGV